MAHGTPGCPPGLLRGKRPWLAPHFWGFGGTRKARQKNAVSTQSQAVVGNPCPGQGSQKYVSEEEPFVGARGSVSPGKGGANHTWVLTILQMRKPCRGSLW